jgi:hypothetical protein
MQHKLTPLKSLLLTPEAKTTISSIFFWLPG